MVVVGVGGIKKVIVKISGTVRGVVTRASEPLSSFCFPHFNPVSQVIAACNPYRVKRGVRPDAESGLVFDHYHGDGEGEMVGGIPDPLASLVYRVHPLPESMVDHIFDFG